MPTAFPMESFNQIVRAVAVTTRSGVYGHGTQRAEPSEAQLREGVSAPAVGT